MPSGAGIIGIWGAFFIISRLPRKKKIPDGFP